MQKGLQLAASLSLSLGVLFGTYALAYADSSPLPLHFPMQRQSQIRMNFPMMNFPLPQLNLNGQGLVRVMDAKVTSISDSTISATQSWGSFTENWTIEVPSSTRNGASSDSILSSIAVGDQIGFTGQLDNTESSATVRATSLIDYTSRAPQPNPGQGDQDDQGHGHHKRGHGHGNENGNGNATSTTSGMLSGTVSSIDSSNSSFVLATSGGNLTVTTNNSTLITNASGATSFSSIQVGASVVRAFGALNSASSTLAATEVDLAQTPQTISPVPADHLFSGVLSSIASTTAPTTLTVASSTANYTVNLVTSTALLGYNWNPISLSQIRPNDQISILGRAESGNSSLLDAYVLRDLNVQ